MIVFHLACVIPIPGKTFQTSYILVTKQPNSNKKFCCRREAARCFVSVVIALTVQYLERSLLLSVYFGFRSISAYN